MRQIFRYGVDMMAAGVPENRSNRGVLNYTQRFIQLWKEQQNIDRHGKWSGNGDIGDDTWISN